jgi:outer membrane protein assembly factor BamB
MRPIAAIILLLATVPAWGGDWPRFMGPDGTGVVATGEKVARSWPADGPEVLWNIKVGEGFGGVSIAGGKVYLLDRSNNERDIFRVFDLKSGHALWEYPYATAPLKASHPGSRSTPTVDGDRVYTVGLMGEFHCFDVPGKKVVWKKSLRQDFNADAVPWGFAQSPLILRDMVITAAVGKTTGLIALNKETGETIWKSQPFGGCDSYTSPMVVTIGGQEQVINWHRGVLAAINPADGTMLWKHDWRTNRPVPQPVHLGGGRFFLTVGYGGGCAMIKVNKSGGGGADGDEGGDWDVTEIFQDTRSGCRVPPALFYQGHIYTNSDDNKRGLQCLDADGNVKWETVNKPQFGQGSLIIADGVIFIIDDSTGELVMVEASPTAYKELGRAKLLGGRDIWAPLALSDGRLVLRDQQQMKCVDVGARAAGSE